MARYSFDDHLELVHFAAEPVNEVYAVDPASRSRADEPAPVSTVDDETYAEHLRLGRPQADDGGE